MSTTSTTPSSADQALRAAEQEIAALRQKVHDLSAAGDADANLFKLERQISDNRTRAAGAEEMTPLTREFVRLRVKLNKTEPTTLAGAIVKLRQLADPAEGIEQGPLKGDFKSLRQALAFLEGEAAAGRPEELTASEPERAKLRERAEALAVELAAPLPDGDAGLVEAERRLRENEAREKEIYRDFREFPDKLEIEEELIIGMIDPALEQLRSFLENTTASSLPGALAKLRFVADPRRDYLEDGDVAQAMVADVVAVLERETQP